MHREEVEAMLSYLSLLYEQLSRGRERAVESVVRDTITREKGLPATLTGSTRKAYLNYVETTAVRLDSIRKRIEELKKFL